MRLSLTATAAIMALAVGMSAADAKTLRMADSTDVSSMDPHSMTESNTIAFLNHIYEGLVRYNDQLQIEPALAESWEVVEPTRVRFHLREGVAFHDGSPFTADDVVASVARAIHPDSPIKSNLPSVEMAEKVDEHTVDLVLTGTDPILLNYLTNIVILDKEWMEANDALVPADIRKGKENHAVANANGTGPFMLESRQPDAMTVLAANPEWWDEPQHNLTRIEFTPIASDATRIAALLSGELDFITPAPLQDIERINAAPGTKVFEATDLRTIMLAFNHGEKLHDSNLTDANPLSDARVRRALMLAVDMDLIQKKVMRGKSRNAGILVAPPIPGYDAAIDERAPADPEQAKALLAEAGYPDGFEVGFDCSNNRYVNDEEICQAITSMWARVGVDAKIQTQTIGKMVEKALGGRSDIFMFGWATEPMLDAYSVLSALLHTPDERMGAWNPGGYSNPKIDELTQKVAVELDLEQREAMMTEALRLAKEDVALVPLHQQPLAWAVREGVELKVTPDNKPRLWYATIAD
jgi:peptide/nickel transport system substrate-binding protein